MKAAVLLQDKQIEIQDRQIPALNPGEYLVKLKAVGICNSDIFRGFFGGAYNYPLVMGHEICGEVVSSFDSTADLKVGEQVVVFPLLPCRSCESCLQKKWVLCDQYDYYGSRRDGGFQEYMVVKEWNLLKTPPGLSPEIACLVEPLSVCFHALDRVSPVDIQESILIIGGGILGISTGMILKSRGFLDITIIDRNQFKCDLIESMGLSSMSMEDLANSTKRFQLVIESCGALMTYKKSLEFCNKGGQVLWMGNLQDEITFSKGEISSILRKEISICGTWNSNYQRGLNDDWSKALNFMNENDFLSQLISHKIVLEDLDKHLEKLYQTKNRAQKHSFLKSIVKF
ncbi:alcohol dehydrogenase catalytic domain-containing protein [bacterium]|nr:alcohol dehydrogenase catalytic domain-containing protein [bacterium]